MNTLGPYGRLAQLVLTHRSAVWAMLAVIGLVSALLGLPPRVASSLLELMPLENPAVRALHDLNEEEGGVNLLTLAFEAEDPAQLDPFLDDLVSALEKQDTVAHAIHEVDPELAYQIGVLQLAPGEVAELTVRMKGALALGPALNPIVTQRLMDMGPLTERIANADGASLLGNDDGLGRVMIRPTGSSNDQAFVFSFMEGIEAEIADVEARHPGVSLIWMGGAYRHIVEDVEGIRSDLVRTSFGSAFLVLGVIIIAFRSVRATVLVMVPLILANLVNLAVVWVFLESLNTYTSFATAILIGLGIDFAVHLVGRYRELRAAGEEVEEAVMRAWDMVGPPCTTAALTSAAGFLALAAANFRGFSQLGVLLAAGLVICLLAMLVMLPLLIVVLDREPRALLGMSDAGTVSNSTYALAPLALMVLVLATGFTGASRLPNLSWEHDMSALRRDGLSYEELGEVERALARESYSPSVVSYDDRAELVVAQRHLEKLIGQGKLDHVARVVSIENVLPSDQSSRLAALRELQSLLTHPNLRYLPPPLVEKLLPLRGRKLGALERSDLPEGLLTVLGAGNEDRHRILIFPKGNMWDMRNADALSVELRNALPERPIAGEHIMSGAMYRMVQADMPVVGFLALFLVAVITAIDLRRAHWIIGAMGTLLAGMVWAGSMVQAFGVKLSMINIVGVPILLGIGVDVVIHLLHRLREEGPGGVRRALKTTGLAAMISTVTTILSFLSLVLAGNRGVRSLGMLVVVGLASVFLASAVILPTAWAAGWKMTGRAPGGSVPER